MNYHIVLCLIYILSTAVWYAIGCERGKQRERKRVADEEQQQIEADCDDEFLQAAWDRAEERSKSPPMTPEQRQFAIDYIFSDAPEAMKQELGVRPLRFVNQDGKPLDGGIGLHELGRQMAEKREKAALDCILGANGNG